MKTVVIEKVTRDVQGLLKHLRAAEPKLQVLNVGVDHRKTYVYLEDAEEQDPTPLVAQWEDSASLRLVPMNALGPDGIPEAKIGDVESHVILVEKVGRDGEVTKGDEELYIRVHGPFERHYLQKLSRGTASIQVGPSRKDGLATLTVSDLRGMLGSAEVTLRFKTEEPAPVPEPAEDGVVTSETLVPDAALPVGAGETDIQTSPGAQKPWWRRLFRR